MTTHDITVLVPLHRSERFVDIVAHNLARLEGHCRLVVSDATEVDGALTDLRASHPSADVTWIGRRPIDPGWIAHYNDLLARVETPLLMWLPHDDEIDLDYLTRCVSALTNAGPDVAGAFGWIDCVEGPGLHPVELSQPLPSPTTAMPRAEQLVLHWNLGLAMRAVFRREALIPIAPTNAGSEWADIVWIFGLVLDHDIVHVRDARYRKRFHPSSEHASWRPHVHPLALPHLLAEFDRRPTLPDRERRRRELLAASVGRAAEVIDAIDADRHALRSAMAAAQDAHRTEVDRLRRGISEVKARHAELASEYAEMAHWRERAAEQEAIAEATRRSGAFRVGAALTAPLRAIRRRRSPSPPSPDAR